MKKLHIVNEGLKTFAHVNKKAFEPYTKFTKQQDQLLERQEELESIEELVEVLDQRKDKAIERTFKQVASNFEESFQEACASWPQITEIMIHLITSLSHKCLASTGQAIVKRTASTSLYIPRL